MSVIDRIMENVQGRVGFDTPSEILISLRAILEEELGDESTSDGYSALYKCGECGGRFHKANMADEYNIYCISCLEIMSLKEELAKVKEQNIALLFGEKKPMIGIGEALRVVFHELLCQCYKRIEILPNPDSDGEYPYAVVINGNKTEDHVLGITASMMLNIRDTVDDFEDHYRNMLCAYNEVRHENEMEIDFTGSEIKDDTIHRKHSI